MRKFLGIIVLLLVAAVAYLAFAPVPIDPVAWEPPEDAGYTGRYSPNTELADLERLDMGEAGPEDIVIRDGLLYAPSESGRILTHDLATGDVREVADTGGIPLGLEFDAQGRLLVADASLGLLRIDDGEVEVLSDSVDGSPILYADDVDSGPDGRIYFTDASTKFGAVASGGTVEGSLLEIMEHGRTGRVLVFDPRDGTTNVLADGLSFPNGLAMSADGRSVLVNITGEYSTLRIPVDILETGGAPEVLVDNYPGFPDNINRGPDIDGPNGTKKATYIVGLVSPRSAELDRLAGRPGLRKVVQRLPASVQPKATHYTHMVVIDDAGEVLASWQDPAGGYRSATGGVVHAGQLYLSSLTESHVARRPVPDLFGN